MILITAAGAAPSPHANVIASFTLPLDCIALEKIIKTNLMENGFFGVLNDISLEDYIQLICMKNATKGIRVSQQNDKGLILIRDGKIMYAAQDSLLGMEAFIRIMSWKKGSFREVKIKLFPQPNIDKDYRSLLLEAAVYENMPGRKHQRNNPGSQKKPPLNRPMATKLSQPPQGSVLPRYRQRLPRMQQRLHQRRQTAIGNPMASPNRGKRQKNNECFLPLPPLCRSCSSPLLFSLSV